MAAVSAIPSDFSSAAWTKSGGASGTATRLTVNHASGTGTAVTAVGYSLDESRVFWKITQRPTTGTLTCELSGGARNSSLDVDSYIWTVGPGSGGALIATYADNFATYYGTGIAWDNAKPFLSIRETGGTVYWERSATGTAWETVRSVAYVLSSGITNLKLSFWTDPGGSGSSWVESLNTGGAPAAGKGHVVIGAAKKTVANRWVIQGGVKKAVANVWVIQGGVKKTTP